MKKHILPLLLCLAATAQAGAQELMRVGDKTFPVSKVKKMTPTQYELEGMSQAIAADATISLFASAMEATGWSEAIKTYRDYTYSVGRDSIDWTNRALVIHVATEYDNVAYMPQRYVRHTVFAEPDTVLQNKYGITTLDQLRKKAHELYDPVYPDDASVSDEKDTRNALNRFVAYHILPFQADYYQLTCVDGGSNTLSYNWDRTKIDISDWYETCMPYSTMKLSFPMGSAQGLYINRRGVQSRADERGVLVRGAKVMSASDTHGIINTCTNGVFYYIDDIIAYGQETQQVVFDDRLRIDCTTLSPDFMTSGARGHYTRSSIENGKYARWEATGNTNNTRTCLGFKAGSAKNFEFKDNETHLHVRPRTLSFWSYQGDEVCIQGRFDVTVKLPPVPRGSYELRLGTCVNFQSRGVVQFYIDDQPVGLPVDMRPGGTALFGWKSDVALTNRLSEEEAEAAITAFDDQIRQLGWMKGPASYYSSAGEQGGVKGTCFRDTDVQVRYIIGHFESDGKTEHYLRMKQIQTDGSGYELDFDYIELVPKTVFANPEWHEDRW